MPLTTTLSLALVVVVVGVFVAGHQQPDTVDDNQEDEELLLNRHCDSDECDALVAKCNLTNKCTCDLKQDKHCARRCINCLEEKFGKCCACVGLCQEGGKYKEPSHVGKLNTSDEYVAYFNVLTEDDDKLGRWSVFRHHGITIRHPEHGQLDVAYRFAGDDTDEQVISYNPELEKLNCTVAFINRSLGMSFCKKACTHMGASYYRWFHEGCCECSGKYCLNYGIDEPKCKIDNWLHR